MNDFIGEAISAQFGDRCEEYAEGCPCCDAWAQYDNLVSENERLREVLEFIASDEWNNADWVRNFAKEALQ